ncbi:MAG: hypothetical protein HY303_03250, partial [Candidatus Wallbacteria bacterium]|nr:hypothetical protein [Candidatus Wallbacteria bacterium]
AHPGDLDKGMELVKGGVDIAVSVLEADPGNAIAERRLRLARRVYPEWLQFAPYRVRWVAR